MNVVRWLHWAHNNAEDVESHREISRNLVNGFGAKCVMHCFEKCVLSCVNGTLFSLIVTFRLLVNQNNVEWESTRFNEPRDAVFKIGAD